MTRPCAASPSHLQAKRARTTCVPRSQTCCSVFLLLAAVAWFRSVTNLRDPAAAADGGIAIERTKGVAGGAGDAYRGVRGAAAADGEDSAPGGVCALRWDWPMLDAWSERRFKVEEGAGAGAGAEVVRLWMPRSNVPTARGRISITVQTAREPVRSVAVRVLHRDATSDNAWHRLAVQYMAWIGLRTAARRVFGAGEGDFGNDGGSLPRALFLIRCGGGDVAALQGWSDLGDVACDEDVRNPTWIPPDADALVVAPKEGLLWDLDWDNDFDCGASDMFMTFLDLYRSPGGRRRPSTDPAPQPLGCFVERKNRPMRGVENREELLDLMGETFAAVRRIDVTVDHSTAEVVDLLDDCRVVIGVHGAGLLNTLFSPPDVTVVEILPKDEPAHYRNICKLAGHRYKAIHEDFGIQSNAHVNIENIREVFYWALARPPE